MRKRVLLRKFISSAFVGWMTICPNIASAQLIRPEDLPSDSMAYLSKCRDLAESMLGSLDLAKIAEHLQSVEEAIYCSNPITWAWLKNHCSDDEPIIGEIIGYLGIFNRLLGSRAAQLPLDGQISFALAAGKYCRMRNQANQKQAEPLLNKMRDELYEKYPAFQSRQQFEALSWEAELIGQNALCNHSLKAEICSMPTDTYYNMEEIRQILSQSTSYPELAPIRIDVSTPSYLALRGHTSEAPEVAISGFRLQSSKTLYSITRLTDRGCIVGLMLEDDANGLSQVKRVADFIGPFSKCGSSPLIVVR